MSAACRLDGCTVLQTGVCAREDDPATCSNRILEIPIPAPSSEKRTTGAAIARVGSADDLGAAVLTAPKETPSFPRSTVLGLQTVETMMGCRYATVVGILGDPESGKTACLVSLYLLVSRARLNGWSFADSRSLMAFEQISRGARRWLDGQQPDQMTVHTELADHRTPGFVHLRLRHDSTGAVFDFFLPDLPGEWTKALVNKADTGRLEFMKSADVIWLMTDGRTLINKETRQGVIHRLGLVIDRLSKILGDRTPKLILIPTHRDHGEVPTYVFDQIRKDMSRLRLPLEIRPVASFSDDKGIVPGHGLADLIDATACIAPEAPPFWPSSPIAEGRAFLSFRRNE